MNSNRETDSRIEQLVAWYGDGSDGAAPTREQWHRLLAYPEGDPVSLVNFFKIRDRAHYAGSPEAPAGTGTGQEAFDRYAAVSIPTFESLGGKFVLMAPFTASLVGEQEDWDLVVAGAYPNKAAVLALFENRDYRAAFVHRTAACERQKVSLCAG